MNKERTGWRDEAISGRHRTWGIACPATDLDFVLVERYFNDPVAIVEYKNEHISKTISFTDGNIVSLRKLSDKASLPFFVVVYKDTFASFGVAPANEIAKSILQLTGSVCKAMSEKEYVELMYKIRGEPLPYDIAKSLFYSSNNSTSSL